MKFKAKFKSEYNKIINSSANKNSSKNDNLLFKVVYPEAVEVRYGINSDRSRNKNDRYVEVMNSK
ncbi:MAG: hypothetical protein RSC84_04325 [Peptostreptococcaceae bacterium]